MLWWRRGPAAGCGRADLVFVLDSSASIGDKNYWMLKQWTVDLMRGLGAVSPRDSRVAAVIYSDNAQKQWGLRGEPSAQPTFLLLLYCLSTAKTK